MGDMIQEMVRVIEKESQCQNFKGFQHFKFGYRSINYQRKLTRNKLVRSEDDQERGNTGSQEKKKSTSKKWKELPMLTGA